MSANTYTPPKRSRAKTIFLWCIAIGIIGPGGIGFIDKFVQFLRTLAADEGGGFTIIPIMNYLLVTAGMTCLLVWAVVHGMFRDIEKPKHTMLETEEKLDAKEGIIWDERP